MHTPTHTRTRPAANLTARRPSTRVSLWLALGTSAAISLHCARATPLERQLAERALRAALNEAVEKSAASLAEHSAAAAIQKLGKKGAKEAVERGGIQLLEAGAKHGEAFWSLVQRAPESVHYLAAKPAEALALARRFGDEAVRLEARVPGMAEKAAAQFGGHSLEALSKASPGEVKQLIGYAQAAENPAVRNRLWEEWQRRGAGVLAILDKNKTLILTSGLTLAMLDVAHGVGNGLEEAIPAIPDKTPRSLELLAARTGDALLWSMTVLSSAAGLVLLWRYRPRRNPGSVSEPLPVEAPRQPAHEPVHTPRPLL